MHNLDQITEELNTYVKSAPNETTKEARQKAADKEKRIWGEVFKAQNEQTRLSKQVLDLANLELDVLSPTLCKLPSETLRFLNLSCNELKELPANIGNLEALEGLRVGENNLKKLPADIGKVKALKTLYVEKNYLEELPADIGNLRALRFLDVSGNKLTLPKELCQLEKLEKLNLNQSQLSELPANIGNLTALKTLYVKENYLEELPADIGNLRALRFLDVSGNELTTLPATIGNLRPQTQVEAEDNPITSFPESIGSWNRIELSISGGNLPASVREALRNLSTGPNIQYNMMRARQAQTIAEDRKQARNLELAVEPWIPPDHPGEDVLLQEYRTIREECESTGNTNSMREFSRLLDRLPEMADFKIDTATVIENVAKILHVVRTDEAGRNKLFETAQIALGTCGDRVAEGWSSMLTALDNYHAIRDDWPLEKRLSSIQGEWLHQHIELKTRELCKNIRFTDPVEIAIGFKMQLAKEFKLPNVMKRMLYADCARTTNEQLQEMRDYLHGLDKNKLIDYVAEHPLWKETMQQRHQDTFQRIDKAFTHLMEKATEIEDFASPPPLALTSPVLKELCEKTVDQEEWVRQTLNEIGDAKDYALKLICVREAQAALLLMRTPREKAAHEAGSSSSGSMLEFKPKSRLVMKNEAAKRWEARRSCLENFSLKTVDEARRPESRPAAGERQLSEEALFTLDDYENLKKSTPLKDYIEQIKTATGASAPRCEWADLDKTYNGVAPVGRLANKDHTFILVPDSATPDSPHVRVILAPASALHKHKAAELDGIIAKNSVKQANERIKVSVNCQGQATQLKRKSKTL